MDTPEEDRCTATTFIFDAYGEETELRCTQDRRHIMAPVGFMRGRVKVYLMPEARPHRFEFRRPS